MPLDRAFKAERHGDGAGEFVAAGGPIVVQAGVGVVEFELPAAVEVQPELTLELRLRIFRPRQVVGAEQRKRKKSADRQSIHRASVDSIGIGYE